ncbi:MAG TPA: C2 family cysteine protease [Gemmataceae bacterium]|jgi:hypothetical protein
MRTPRTRSARSARLLLTPLEDRTVPTAGLAVTFSGGILRVTDWRPGDTVAVHQMTSGVTLDAAGGHQTFAGVGRVLLDVQGDARVTNDVSGLGGAAPREVYLSRRDATGTKFASTGDLAPGATSGPAAPVAPTPPQPPVPTPSKKDWFDAAVSDLNLRSLTRSLAVDGSLGRSDWLQLFAEVGADGTVSSAEYHDLGDLLHTNRVTFSTTVGFTLPDAVRVLAGKVVDGDPANARYQGAALGNLRAGSAAGQLQKLVGKWFLGTDHPQAAAGMTYRVVGGALFVNGAAYADVRQGQVGDCYFVAALAEIAKDSPQAIRQMFTDNGDGTFTVRFYHNGKTDYVTVDRALPTTSAGTAEYASFGGRYDNGGNELWVALAEKAYAQLNEAGWLGHAAANSYAAIDGGYSDLAIEHVTGVSSGWKWVQNATPTDLISAANSGRYTVLGSKQTAPGNGVIASHGYALVGYNAATGRFTLYNPWGSTIALTWAQIQQSFNGFWQAGL